MILVKMSAVFTPLSKQIPGRGIALVMQPLVFNQSDNDTLILAHCVLILAHCLYCSNLTRLVFYYGTHSRLFNVLQLCGSDSACVCSFIIITCCVHDIRNDSLRLFYTKKKQKRRR